jgi:hypothetical protein
MQKDDALGWMHMLEILLQSYSSSRVVDFVVFTVQVFDPTIQWFNQFDLYTL